MMPGDFLSLPLEGFSGQTGPIMCPAVCFGIMLNEHTGGLFCLLTHTG